MKKRNDRRRLNVRCFFIDYSNLGAPADACPFKLVASITPFPSVPSLTT
jgi:hypothetical protein